MRHQLQVPQGFLIFPLLPGIPGHHRAAGYRPAFLPPRPPAPSVYIMAPSPASFLSILAVSFGGKSSWETLNLDFQQVLDDSAWSHHIFTGDSRHTMSSKPQSLSPTDRLLPFSTWLVRGPRDPRHFLSFSNTYFYSPCRLGWLLVTANVHLLVLRPLARPTVWWSHTQPSPPTVPPALADPPAGSFCGPEPDCHDPKPAGKALSFNACAESGRRAGHPGSACVMHQRRNQMP